MIDHDTPDTQATPEAVTEASPERRIAELEAALAEAQAEAERLRDQHLRALAETENVRRRAERDKDDVAKYAVQRLARDLLNVADNLRRALDSAPAADPAAAALIEGVAATERELAAAFGRHGIERIDPEGQPFDPNFHQAVLELPDATRPPGTVARVMAPGYTLHGRLLRPAMVAVARAPAGAPEPAEPTVDG